MTSPIDYSYPDEDGQEREFRELTELADGSKYIGEWLIGT
jgi:hypothetical protein